MKYLNSNKTKYYSGLTLIEMLVYVALFGMIFLGVIQFLLAVTDNNQLTQQRTEIDRYKVYLFNHFEESFNWADGVDDLNSVFDDDDGTLVLIDSADPIHYYLNSGTLEVSQGANIYEISGDNITVTKLRFEPIADIKGSVIGVNIEADFELTNNSNISDSINHVYRLY